MDSSIEKISKKIGEAMAIRLLESNPSVIKSFDDGIEYIPIGENERQLDILTSYSWSIIDFSYSVDKIGSKFIVSGRCTLQVLDRTMVGARSFEYSRYGSEDIAGICLSLCISNACKRLGKVFGRHLNGRMEFEEQQLNPVPDSKEEFKPSKVQQRVIKLINQSLTAEELDKYEDSAKENGVLDFFIAKKSELNIK